MSELLHEFVDWLAERWTGDFRHSYRINASLHWKWYRKNFDPNTWSCTSLSDALLKYSWAGFGYEENKKLLDEYASALQDSLRRDANSDAEACCNAIIDWGNVRARSTKRWLKELGESKGLCLSLSEAIAALRRGDTSRFMFPKDYLMNSGTTKIYSLGDCSGALIIYDGRVGAALGYLAARFLTQRKIFEVPEELGFMWGQSRPTRTGRHLRNPSAGPYKFRELGIGANKNWLHANMVAMGSRLIEYLSRKTGVTAREWEAALFMIGYELPAA